ncbi:DUF3426 domain-containing protein [Nitrincola iocasae]|uniref:DUF3426 domain-containing protein n=1 Tax=Nitrincola iocasae TaxID=2614693 RepID=A0A5J6LAE3_9GAMM|nr:DUF3426 domain-containing protein [Nitrincola iocasae]QEW05569.1 DUF3426 domain-containing protein [Nitrincola iocasae]
MKKLVAQCPSCQTRYNVTQGQLKVADGRVRCGQCLTVFRAVNSPSKTETAPSTAKPKASSHPDTQKIQPDTPKPKTDPLTLLRQMQPDPPELSPAPPRSASAPTWSIVGSFLALVLLAGQYLWFERANLAQKPLLVPVYIALCDQLDCALPSYQSLLWLQTSHLLVRSQAEQSDTLEVLTGLVNTSPLPVPLPIMRLQFTDASGRIIAATDFQPDAYLGNSDTTQLQPGQRQAVRLLLQRPAPGHLGYELDWLPSATH